MATTLAQSTLEELAQGDYGIIVSNQEDNDAFAKHFLPAFTSTKGFETTFCSPYIAVLMRDIWLMYYYGRENVIVNQTNTMIHSVRYALIQALTKEQALVSLDALSLNNAQKSFYYSTITTNYLMHWLTEYVLRINYLNEDYQLVKSIKMQKYHEVYEEQSTDITPLPRHWVVAQANLVKAIHQSLVQEDKLFSSVMKDAITHCLTLDDDATIADVGRLLR